MSINTVFNGMEQQLRGMFFRWQDEKKYENIEDYAAIVRPKVEAMGAKFIKMTKRPFGFQCMVDGKTYQMRMSTKKYDCVEVL